MGKSILLIGPMEGGKTQLIKTLKCEPYPQYDQTNEAPKSDEIKTDTFLGKLGLDHIKITEYGGLVTGWDRSLKEIKKYDAVIFVFNGVEFLKQLKDYENGAQTTSRIRQLFSQMKNNEERIRKKVFFIATHADEYSGDLGNDIHSYMGLANKEYKSVSNNSLRYPFYNYFEGAKFYCLDATENGYDAVLDAFLEINKYK